MTTVYWFILFCAMVAIALIGAAALLDRRRK